ncbi:hypothetical protein EN829_015880 [Mesorhizobium sp. M00.F.Ca.ET.186.01.1.1]|nr:hypothetical protein EN848_13555 [bacterium M00.F.Ca.ET.205.01.1.1]TGU53146.1 hypothetical protein EN795_15835 [bacterium M00.F.Ca.ET.152.01.1.1]TGV36111.1 hypothetical protein EN829_015880 [Mesorhizobium sp. M00.F.Ca.ET.186.01.1.1]TGZ43699.1 hypothetical protein EN805_11450 [bacterium M00.F.Ca.ET.162.01.1.1]
MDIVDLTERFPIEAVVKETVKEVTSEIYANFSEREILRHSIFLDFIRSNLEHELDEDSKEKYGEFVELFSNKVAEKYSYDRKFIFLIWGLVVRKRWMDNTEFANWVLEVVEGYFDQKGWEINNVYDKIFNTLSK